MARLFVAVWPPAEVLDRLEELPRPDEPGVRYTTRDQWHVTLRFLGEAEEGEAMDALGGLVGRRSEVTIGPRVGRLGRDVVVVPAAGLADLAAGVAGATAAVGEPPDARPFAGHVTLARSKRRGACGIAGAPIAARFAVTEVHLVSSDLAAGGARYESVGRVTLGR